jgi:hypothetical protein
MEAGTAPLDAPRTREVDLEAREEKRSATARRGTPSLRFWDGFSVFAIFAAIYFIIGYKVVVELHVVNFDSLSRLAHAYFVWFNDPAKLAAIGFVWPPVQTLIYLPFALFGELATSLAALPAASATFMAATVLMISHALRACGVPWLARWPLLLGFGLNPMIVYYGANGMAESVYLFFLTFAIFFLIRWRQTHQNHLLAFVGFGVGLSMLSRYEIVPFAIVFALGIALVILTTWQRSERARSIESGLVLYLAPVIYFGLTWLFFNWLILGDPLYFLSFGATNADVSTSQQNVGGLAARDLSPTEVIEYLVKLNYALFPLTLAAGIALTITAFVKRSPLSIVLAALLATNAAVTAILFLRTADPNLLQLRYNMRAMPIAMMGVAWLFFVYQSRGAKIAIWAVSLAILVVSIPVTWKTMETYSYQYEENVFLRALETGEDQEGNIGIAGYPIGIAAEQDMADFISENVGEDQVILTDDSQSLGVMLLSGDPGRFFDRIDKGDEKWFEQREDPWGEVDYFLVATNERCRAPCTDLIRDRYEGVLADGFPGLEIVFETDRYALVSVAEERPESLEDPEDLAAAAEAEAP